MDNSGVARNKIDNIYIVYSDNIRAMTLNLLEKMDVKSSIPHDALISIKPNLVLASPSEYGATTNPEIVRGIIEYLRNKKFKNIEIIESAWLGADTEEAFHVCGYRDISKEYGVPLFDLKKDGFEEIEIRGIKIKVCKKALSSDFLINVPVLKVHCQTLMTCSLKNLKGCIPDIEKRRFHTMGIHRPVALLNKIVKSHLIIVDSICGDLTFEEGGNPVRMDRLIAGWNPFNMDVYCAGLIGYEICHIEYLKIAMELNIGHGKFHLVELNKCSNVTGDNRKRMNNIPDNIIEKSACSACLGSLIHALHKINTKNLTFYIGQGFKGICGKGIGIGNCSSGFDFFVKGCPPTGKDIIAALKTMDMR